MKGKAGLRWRGGLGMWGVGWWGMRSKTGVRWMFSRGWEREGGE
jgi:hypothetical protein